MRIAIIGAGPAGCHLAHRLAGNDHDILLFDPRTPWEKPCGGGLSPLAGQLFPDVMALPFPRQNPPRLLLGASDGSQAGHQLEPSAWGIVSREELGRALLDRVRADGHVRHLRQQVTGIERTEAGWYLRTAAGETLPTDFVVGADGVHSLVRRRVVGPIPRRHLGMAVGYLVTDAPDTFAFQTFADLHGYLWSFPRPDHVDIGICCRLGKVRPRELWGRVDSFLAEHCAGSSKQKRWAALLPMAQDSTLWDTPCVGPGWALLGDAAGHVHPITGEGIAYALWSADLLAEAFLHDDPALYERLWRERYGGALASAAETIRNTSAVAGVFEMIFHLAMVAALSPGNDAA